MDNKITEEWRTILKYDEYEVANLDSVQRLAYYKQQ